MHMDSFAKFAETLNWYILKKKMKWNTRIIVKLVASTRGEFHNQLMCYNAIAMYYLESFISWWCGVQIFF